MSSSPESNDGDVVKDLLASVASALDSHEKSAIFAVGGSIPATDQRPVVLRWDSDEPYRGHSVSLPLSNDEGSQNAFARLLGDCAPATFGLGNKDVLDESYRKAGKMAASRFSVDFGPYENGIMHAVTQALVHKTHRGLRAELYSLNVTLLEASVSF